MQGNAVLTSLFSQKLTLYKKKDGFKETAIFASVHSLVNVHVNISIIRQIFKDIQDIHQTISFIVQQTCLPYVL